PPHPGLGHVQALHFDVQAKVEGSVEYAPLIDVGGLPCWPSRPDFAQLEDGARIEREGRELESPWEKRVAGEKSLSIGVDFDLVVLGIGVGAVPMVCSELI